jgi:hypothetical protein
VDEGQTSVTKRFACAFAILVFGPCLLQLSACGSTSVAPSNPPLRSLALRLSDLPPSTTADSARFWSNAQAATRDHVPVAAYQQHGRILSYQDSFERHVMNGSEPTWLLHTDSEITAFRGAAGARWYFGRMSAAMKRSYVTSTNNLGANAGQTGLHIHFHLLAIPPLGNRRVGLTANSGGDEMGFTTRVLIFQRGRYVVFLRVRGLLDQTILSKVVAIGRRIDHRLAASH